MKVTIAQVDQNLYDGEAASLSVPASEGVMTILPDHEPIIATLKEGVVAVRPTSASEPQEFPITGGVLEVSKAGAVVIL